MQKPKLRRFLIDVEELIDGTKVQPVKWAVQGHDKGEGLLSIESIRVSVNGTVEDLPGKTIAELIALFYPEGESPFPQGQSST
jgi:hypothetical protein